MKPRSPTLLPLERRHTPTCVDPRLQFCEQRIRGPGTPTGRDGATRPLRPPDRPAQRRGLDATRQILAARAARTNMTFAFVAIDLDDFKAVNDQHGHGTGDLVLQEFAVRLTACCRSEDVRVRLGGDEFLLLLPEMNAAAACQLVERVRAWQPREPLVTECVGTVPITREVWKPRRSSAD